MLLFCNFIITAQWHVDCGINRCMGTETRRPAWTPTAVSGWRDGCGSGLRPTDDRVKSAEGWLSNTVFTFLSEKWHSHTHTLTHTNHCSGLSHWSHMPGPEFEINERLQSSQTITNLRTQWQYFHITHSSGKEKDHTKITDVHLNHRVSITRGRVVFLEKKKQKTENKQNDNALKVICMHENIQAAESLIQRLL